VGNGILLQEKHICLLLSLLFFLQKKISIVLNFFFFRNLIPLVWFVAVLMELFLMSCVAKKERKIKKTGKKLYGNGI
jgi:uncharacterized integral membrane protein